jgi:branched-chain amino acid transport system ATP-binding protein
MAQNGHLKSTLEVRGITKSFGAIQAVREVSFDVYPGEILGVIGPNGCGKTTLFNCILGQLKPDSGSVILNGANITRLSASARSRSGLGRTFQLLQVFDSMKVTENLLTAAQAHVGTVWDRLFRAPDLGMGGEVKRVAEQFRMGHLRGEIAKNLSFGQQKLLDIGMGLMSGPQIVFLDEPAGGVNLSMLADVKQQIVDLNREGTTFVVIEHNMEFIFEVAHRILVMAEGQVLIIGSAEEVRNDSRVIEAYLGH